MIPGMLYNIRMETEQDFQHWREYLESMPVGLIEKWHDSWGKLPSGYIICDGEKGTPDLRMKGQSDQYYIIKEIRNVE